jgi:hypothetical protein
MGALGAWLGASTTLVVFVGSGLLAAVAWLGLFSWRLIRPRGPEVKNVESEIPKSRIPRRPMMPYAVPVTIVTWCVMSMKLLTFYGVTMK